MLQKVRESLRKLEKVGEKKRGSRRYRNFEEVGEGSRKSENVGRKLEKVGENLRKLEHCLSRGPRGPYAVSWNLNNYP